MYSCWLLQAGGLAACSQDLGGRVTMCTLLDMHIWLHMYISKRMDGWMDGWMDAWMDRRKDRGDDLVC